MSWTEVDFRLVRYSPVEGTHYFYDPAHPTSIQFLLDGNWESWDVGYVKYKAQDPDVRRVAEEAEGRLLRNGVPGYRQWPSEPPQASPAPFAHPSPEDSLGSPIASPLFENPTPSPQLQSHVLSSLRPEPPTPRQNRVPAPASPPHDHPYYTTQYEAEPAPPNVDPALLPPVPSAASKRRKGKGPVTLQNMDEDDEDDEEDEVRATPRRRISTRAPPASTRTAPAPAAPTQAPPLPPVSLLPNHDNDNVNGRDLFYSPMTPEFPPQHLPQHVAPQEAGSPDIVISRNRETKILLSLDGDGVRGLSQALLVESLVNAVCSKIGGHAYPYQIFDLIGGSSMGGILGLMLGRLRMQAHRAREAYRIVAKEVFLNKRDFFTSVDPLAPPVTHDGQNVENVLKVIVTKELGNQDAVFYDARDDSADVFVVTTRIDIGTNKAALIRSFHTRRITGPEMDPNMTVWQTMRGACIAPRYLQPRDGMSWRPVIEPGIVDHGTAKNNPVRDILYECRKLYRYANDMMVIVSIGSGLGFDPHRELPELGKSVQERSVEGGAWGEKFEADHRELMDRGWMKYFRFQVPDLDDVPLEEWCHEERIKEKTLAYLGRPEVGAAFYACVDAITAVLNEARR